MRGPIDYIVVGFDGPKFDGSVLSALAESIDKGIVALVALSVVAKDDQGTVTVMDVSEFDDEFVVQFAQKYNVDSHLVTAEDKEEVADLLENDTAAALLVIEQLWAKPLKKAIINANGYLIAEGRIHPEAVAELESEEE
ncbi:MAG: DUF6325 family protein [Patescibacteria group bacterium]|jgi:hypothetical protein|nr:DUF6325 family protein [Patescibacteria group bacterium]